MIRLAPTLDIATSDAVYEELWVVGLTRVMLYLTSEHHGLLDPLGRS